MNDINDTLRLTLYDPLQLDEQSFIQGFVARKKDLQQLVQRIKQSKKRPDESAHTVIYAHRGMGKTSLLRRIAIEINQDPTLASDWLPLNYREEQYNINSLHQLWCNTVDSLADWCEKQNDVKTAKELDRLLDDINKNDDLYPKIKNIAQQKNKRLVLLLDNINLILSTLSQNEQWQLRNILQAEDGPLVIACTSDLPEEIQKQDHAFFEFFRIKQLKPLSIDELTQCLKKIADLRGDAGKKTLQEMTKSPEKIITLHRLCGGNPRTLTIIYQALEALAINDNALAIDELLSSVLENVTPLYKARTDELPDQLKQIVDAIALHWDPITNADIANTTGLKSTSISAQLKRLKLDGIIEELTIQGQSKKSFQLAERFYNIWYLMRNGSRRSRAKLRWFSKFIATYYNTTELEDKARYYLHNKVNNQDMYNLLYDCVDSPSLKKALNKQYTLNHIQSSPQINLENLSIKEHPDLDRNTLDFLSLKQALIKNVATAAAEEDNFNQDHFISLVLGSTNLNIENKHAIACSKIDIKDMYDIKNILEEEIFQLKTVVEENKLNYLGRCLIEGHIQDVNDLESILAYSQTDKGNLVSIILEGFPEALADKLDEKPALKKDFEILITQPTTHKNLTLKAQNNLGVIYTKQFNNYSKAEEAYLNAIAINKQDAETWFNLGFLYQNHLNNYIKAEEAYLNAIAIDREAVNPWSNLGNLYQIHLNDYTKSKEAYLNAIAIDSEVTNTWNNLGNLYQIHLNDYTKAEEAYLNAIAIDKQDADPWSCLGNLYQDHLKDYVKAKEAYLNAIEIDKQNAFPWFCLGDLYQDHLNDYTKAKEAYLNAIEIDKQDAFPWFSLAKLYRNHLSDYTKAEEAYLTAIDIDKQNAYPWFCLGSLYKNHLNDYKKAEEAFLNAIEIDKENAFPWFSLGSLYKDHLNDYTKAEVAYLNAIEIDKQHVYSWFCLGHLYQDNLKKPDKAEATYRQAIELGSLNTMPEANLVWLGLQNNRPDLITQYLPHVDIQEPGLALINAAQAVTQQKLDTALTILKSILVENLPDLWRLFRDDLLRLVALFNRHGFYTHLIEFLKQENFDTTLAPFYLAVAALEKGEQSIALINPEMRPEVERMFTYLQNLYD